MLRPTLTYSEVFERFTRHGVIGVGDLPNGTHDWWARNDPDAPGRHVYVAMEAKGPNQRIPGSTLRKWREALKVSPAHGVTDEMFWAASVPTR